MKAYVITMKGNAQSENSASKLKFSSKKVGNKFKIYKFDAYLPEDVNDGFKKYGIKWNYPEKEGYLDISSGMRKNPYTNSSLEPRKACFLSHYELWNRCVEQDQNIIIHEHDAFYLNKLPFSDILASPFDIVGINNPIGATRKSQEYHAGIQKQDGAVVGVPNVDTYEVPQGLAGNSAYVVKPKGARKLIELVKTFGAWPNDAIMCKQLMINMLGVTKTYYTGVQRQQSTLAI